jgi:hypothetical protein
MTEEIDIGDIVRYNCNCEDCRYKRFKVIKNKSFYEVEVVDINVEIGEKTFYKKTNLILIEKGIIKSWKDKIQNG